MVCINNRRQRGGGAIDSILKAFTISRYPGERHARSLASDTFGKAFQFMGPGTDLTRRLNPDETPKMDSQPVNKADYESYKHDLAYKHAKDEYLKNPTPENKKIQMKKVWKADDEFIDEMNNDNEEPMAPIAGKLIQLKQTGEKLGVLPTTKFTGFGTEEETVEKADPCKKLRELVQSEYSTKPKNNCKKKQHGGVLPILPALAVGALTAIAGKLSGDIYDFIKGKITGHGVKVPYHKTKTEKIKYLKDFVNSI